MEEEETARPTLMIRVPKLTNIEFYDNCTRPTVQLEHSTSMGATNMSKRDQLYFKFKKNVVHSNKKAHTLFVLHSDLKRHKNIPHNICDHFHPLHVLSEKWWNVTHSYMYFYPDICELISQLIAT